MVEAYITLRRCHVAAGTRNRLQEDFHTSRASPESKDRGRESECSPSLRTGKAVFPRPALQLMGSTVRLRASRFVIDFGAIGPLLELRSG